MDGEDNDSGHRPGIEHPVVVVSVLEAQVKKRLVECLVPTATGLLKAVDSLPKLGNKKAGIRSFGVARWELHEDLLVEISIEECAEEIKDLDRPVFASG